MNDDDDCLLLVVDFDAGYSQLVDGAGHEVDTGVLDAPVLPRFGTRRRDQKKNIMNPFKRKEDGHG